MHIDWACAEIFEHLNGALEMAEMAVNGNCSLSLVSQVWHIVIPGYVIIPSGRSRGVLWVLKNPLAN